MIKNTWQSCELIKKIRIIHHYPAAGFSVMFGYKFNLVLGYVGQVAFIVAQHNFTSYCILFESEKTTEIGMRIN